MIDWREVNLGGAMVEGLSNCSNYGRGILVWGQREGHPYAATVSSAGEVAPSIPAWPGRVSSALQIDVGELRVTGGRPPLTHPDDDPNEWSAQEVGDPYVCGWVVMGSEDPCNLALSASGRLHAFEYTFETPLAGPWLLPGQREEELVVAGRETGLVVAGRLAPDEATAGSGGSSAAVWAYAIGEWVEVEVDEPLDAYTDAYSWPDPFLAGHLDGFPRVLSHVGTPLPTPQVELDPRHPRVCVAHVDGMSYGSQESGWGGPLVLVVQGRDRVQMLFQHAGGWTAMPGPPGMLHAARLGYVEKEAAWVITDGRLWCADISAVWEHLGATRS